MKHNLIVTLAGLLLTAFMGYYGLGKLGPNQNLPDWLGTTTDTQVNQPPPAFGPNANSPQPTSRPATNATGQRSHLLIGTFNIRIFGQAKLEDATAVNYLLDIARRFDVLAVQELRSVDQSVVPRFVEALNQQFGVRYAYLLGPRQGRTLSKEQYVFIYNADLVQPLHQPWVVNDPYDRLHREPLIASFRCIVPAAGPGDGLNGNPPGMPPAARPFQFTLANVHTDPDVAEDEVNSVGEIFTQYQGTQFVDDDLIVLGDFNAGPDRFGRLGSFPGAHAVIPANVPTNLAGTRCYDNIVFDSRYTTEYTGQAGVFNLVKAYDLDEETAGRISDHFPVWAVFSIYESDASSNVAGQGANFFNR